MLVVIIKLSWLRLLLSCKPMPVCNTQRRVKAHTLLNIAASTNYLTVAPSLTLDLTTLGSDSAMPSSQSYDHPPFQKKRTYGLLSNGPQFVYVEFFNRYGQRVNIGAIPYYSLRCNSNRNPPPPNLPNYSTVPQSTAPPFAPLWCVCVCVCVYIYILCVCVCVCIKHSSYGPGVAQRVPVS